MPALSRAAAVARTSAGRLRELAAVRWVLRHRRALAILVMVAFAIFIVVYVAVRPELLVDVVSIGPWNLALLTGLYVLVLATHWLVLLATVALCRRSIGVGEGLLLTIYSTAANFFGPLQSGPGVRAAYLKVRLGVRLRDFTLATVLYYLVFGAANASLLFVTTLPWLTVLGCVALVAILAVVVWRARIRRLGALVALACVTLVQIAAMATIYAVEIVAVSDRPIDPLSALVYSASANLSLFVSLTPGAIGFREAFLAFAQGLHGVPLDTIVAAGIVDRAFYVLFLAVLFGISSLANLRTMFVARRDSSTGEPMQDGGSLEPGGPHTGSRDSDERDMRT